MERIILKSKNNESIPLLIAKKTKNRIAVFVSGSGDVKDSFLPIAKLLLDDTKTSLLSFSFRGRETGKYYSPEQQIFDLEEVVEYLKKEGYKKISLIPTSMGFISVATILSKDKYSELWGNILMLDPADYPIDHSRGTWSGNEEFRTNIELYSNKLKFIYGSFKISVIFFGLRNYNDSYKDITNEARGIDDTTKFSRLSKEMSTNIWNLIPQENKGDFITDRKLPHAFSRDGDPVQNHKLIANYFRKYIL